MTKPVARYDVEQLREEAATAIDDLMVIKGTTVFALLDDLTAAQEERDRYKAVIAEAEMRLGRDDIYDDSRERKIAYTVLREALGEGVKS